MKIVRNKAKKESKKRIKAGLINETENSKSSWSNSSIKFLADFFRIECSEASILSHSKYVAAD